MDTTLHIPWTNEVLEELVLKMVKMGETTKLDFKSVWDISSGGQKAEFARDIQAMANSVDTAYRNHGFLILGAKPGELLHTAFSEDADKMQATVDQVLREHLGPFVPTQVRQFAMDSKTWGVIVVPPSRNAPHVFVRDTEKYKRGDVFVRVGTTTAKAEPGDFARFFRVHLEDHGRELREELRDLQREVERLKTPGVPAVVELARASLATEVVSLPAEHLLPTNTLDVVRRGLRKSLDPISSALASEATDLRKFLDSREIPWDLNNVNKDNGPAFIDLLNERAGMLWKALALIVENDDEGKHDADVVEVLNALAFDPQAPSGTTFTDFGTNIRLYPLTMALYIVFMVGLRKKRIKLLKEVRELSLSARSHYDEPLPIGTALLYVRSASEVFQTVRDDYPAHRWCDAVGSHAQRWIKAHLFSEFPVLERHETFFFIAEFVLSLLGASAENIARPASGVFLFMSESNAVLKRYLKTEHETLREIFGAELKTLLERFDEWGGRLAYVGGCWGNGFQRGATQLVFPEPAKNM